MAKAKVAAGKAATGQRPLNVRERQAIGALTGYADKINATNPGAIHSTEVVVSRRGLHVKVVYNRDRGVAIADAQPDDGAGTPAPGRSKPTKPAAGKPKAHKAAGSTPNAPADQAGLEQRGRFRKSGGDADQQPVPTDPAAPVTAAEAEEMRSVTAHRVAHHAQAAGLAAGGDGTRLLGDKQTFQPGNHKTRGVRLLRGSPAADMTADLFTAAAEEIILAARLHGGIRIGAPLDDPSMAQLDELLVPPAGATLPSTSEMEQENDEFVFK